MKHHDFTQDVHARIDPGCGMAMSGDYIVQLRRPLDITAIDRERWADLSIRAGDANIFAQHWFMDAALGHSASAQKVRLAIVSKGDGTWLGVLPLVAKPRFGRWPVSNWQSWSATNQFLGSPLVHPNSASSFWNILLGYLDARAGGPILLHCRQFAWDDPACAALINLCSNSGRPFRLLDQYDRPAHLPGDNDARGTQAKGKSRARLRNLRRRLERDHGSVSIDIVTADAGYREWVDAFLALEKSGWKGWSGSALGCASETEYLFRDVIREGRNRGRVQLATLKAGERTLAMSSWFEAGNRGFGFKMTYDEAFRTYAPGQLLMHHVADRIAQNPAIYFDTCAPPTSCSAQSPWNGERRIFDCAIAIGPPSRRLFFGALMGVRGAYAAIAAMCRRTSRSGS